jgi:hypothetical protein
MLAGREWECIPAQPARHAGTRRCMLGQRQREFGLGEAVWVDLGALQGRGHGVTGRRHTGSHRAKPAPSTRPAAPPRPAGSASWLVPQLRRVRRFATPERSMESVCKPAPESRLCTCPHLEQHQTRLTLLTVTARLKGLRRSGPVMAHPVGAHPPRHKRLCRGVQLTNDAAELFGPHMPKASPTMLSVSGTMLLVGAEVRIRQALLRLVNGDGGRGRSRAPTPRVSDGPWCRCRSKAAASGHAP